MKKLMCLVLLVAISVLLVACGNDKKPSDVQKGNPDVQMEGDVKF